MVPYCPELTLLMFSNDMWLYAVSELSVKDESIFHFFCLPHFSECFC